MKTINLQASLRSAFKKQDIKKLRKEDKIPCVLYGGDEENLHFLTDAKMIKDIVYSPNVCIINLNIEGKEQSAILQDVQFHSVSDKILNMDFMRVYDDKKITIKVPVKLTGIAEGVKAGGKIQQKVRKMKIQAFKSDLPDYIDVNVEHLKLGQSVKVQEVKKENITFLDIPNLAIASVNLTRAAKGAATEEAKAEEAAKTSAQKSAEKPEAAKKVTRDKPTKK